MAMIRPIVVPMHTLQVHTLLVENNGMYPNAASGLPVVHYHPFDTGSEEAPAAIDPSHLEQLLASNGFAPRWRFPMYEFDHFHTNTHELLVPFRGKATIMLGGGTHSLEVRSGDVLLVPAGVAHRSVKRTPDFCMVGAYPHGVAQSDLTTDEDPAHVERIVGLGLGFVGSDPVYGLRRGSPLAEAWNLQLE